MIKQRTLKKTVKATGVGLHSGKKVTITLRPAPINTGIIFRRVDVTPVVSILAQYDKVVDTRLCTSIGEAGIGIATVEHLMSALAGLGIDNLYVDVNDEIPMVDGSVLPFVELPIMDGCALPFVILLQSGGILEQQAAKRFIRILKPVRVEDRDKYVQFLPYNGYRISFTIDFDHPVFRDKPQHVEFDFSSTSYVKEIARARTFGFLSDYEMLRERGLVKGGSLDNAVVLDQYRVLNEDGLRFDKELVAHKVLDAIGDVYLLGASLIGAFEGYKSGHELNNRLLHALVADQEAWEYTYFDAESYQPFLGKLLLA